jgi:hypothetical protein
MNKIVQISTTAVALIFATSLIALPSMAQESVFGVQLKPSTQTMSKANNPAPPANAEQKASAGKGSTAMGTGNSTDDTDSFWIEEIDVDGDGDVETADFLWDDEDKVLLIYYEDDFTCENGNPGSGAILMGINGADNPRKRPAGSGFYIISLNEGECGAEEAGLWGCKFDANGNDTTCGIAVLDEKNDDLIIITASE